MNAEMTLCTSHSILDLAKPPHPLCCVSFPSRLVQTAPLSFSPQWWLVTLTTRLRIAQSYNRIIHTPIPALARSCGKGSPRSSSPRPGRHLTLSPWSNVHPRVVPYRSFGFALMAWICHSRVPHGSMYQSCSPFPLGLGEILPFPYQICRERARLPLQIQ